LTPGHGKTLVAAYLVGENGTAAHALMLGLVTTLSHTGAVIILAAVVRYLVPTASLAEIHLYLAFGCGLLIAGLGFWLLMRRLAGLADHVHLGGHHHHDHHGYIDHNQENHEHAHPLSNGPGWWGVMVLGFSGGAVPCFDAIVLFLFAISTQNVSLGLPLLLAFSAGLAAVLVLIGLAVVYLKGRAASNWGENRMFRLLPILSALMITVLGLWLCYSSLNPSA
jgi:ABC-type nickel/cobalt efflux system permease component RcnA